MSRARGAPGRETAMARQVAQLGGLSPNGDSKLEADLLELVGAAEKPPRKTPLPMEAIERMAQLCLRDEEVEEEDEELEDEEELLEELQEVLGSDAGNEAPLDPLAKEAPQAAPEPMELEPMLQERVALYQEALGSARSVGDSARQRRLERGLKTLQRLLGDVRSGKSIQEAEIPPPVALGRALGSQSAPVGSQSVPPASQSAPPASQSAPPGSQLASSPLSPVPPQPSASTLLQWQHQYKLVALQAKRRGDLQEATRCYRLAKSVEACLAAATQGHPVATIPPPPPPPVDPSAAQCPVVAPGPPGSAQQVPVAQGPLGKAQQVPVALEQPDGNQELPVATEPPGRGQEVLMATEESGSGQEVPVAQGPVAGELLERLQQCMSRYQQAAAQARTRGEERKSRMHQRIVKQYQAAIRAHQAGRAIDLSELPVPPDFPPLAGSGVPCLPELLAAASSLLEDHRDSQADSQKDLEDSSPPAAINPPSSSHLATKCPATVTTSSTQAKPVAKAQQQLGLLGGRRRRLAQAALKAKARGDLEVAKGLLRQAKALDGAIAATRAGLPVDISKLPEVPEDKDQFVLVPARGGTGISPQYLELMGQIRQQHELCLSTSRQFSQLGRISEMAKLEQLADECRGAVELLQCSHSRGLPPPLPRYEQRTLPHIKRFLELGPSDLELSIRRAVDLPLPAGLTPGDLEVFVRFEFAHPSVEEAQRGKTRVVRSSNCPEFQQQFRLQLHRGHRGLRRLLHSRGIRLEVTQRGGLFRAERGLGWGLLRLQELETLCEIQQLVQLGDGRRPTGGHLEVSVRIREPLSSPQLETIPHRWLLLDPPPLDPKPSPGVTAATESIRLKSPLPSLNLLNFDREKLERKMQSYSRAQRPVPPQLQTQHQQLTQRLQALRSCLQKGDPLFRKEYLTQLEKYLQLYTEAARRLGTAGSREAAKEALYKRNLVQSELQKLRK